MSLNPHVPGGTTLLWALIYAAIGMYVLPLVLGFVHGKTGKAKEAVK